MTTIAQGASTRTKVALILAAIGAVIGAGTGLAHDGGSLEGTRVPSVNPVNHPAVPDGNWTFDVVVLTGTVKNLAYIVKSPGCPGTTYLEHRIRRPTFGATTFEINGPSGGTADYCSMVNFQGSGTAQVRVTHP